MMTDIRSEGESADRANGGDHGWAPSDRLLEAVGILELLGSRASAGGSNVAESIASSAGGVARRAIGVAGDTARAGLDQWAETSTTASRHLHQGMATMIENTAQTAQQIIESTRETLEHLLEAVGSIAEAAARLAERSTTRFFDALSEIAAGFTGELKTAAARDAETSSARARVEVAR
jgi:hypothetical protein